MPKNINEESLSQKVDFKSSTIENHVPSKKSNKKFFFIIIFLIILVLIVLFFFYFKYTKTEEYKQKQAEKKVSSLVKDVSKLIIVPSGVPTVFDVKDSQVLINQQAFFNGSENGDKLLIYPESSKAIIYSPKRNIIVNSGPVTFDEKK